MTQYPCSKCDGKGTIQGFTHVLNGVCFRCGGTGKQKSRPRKQVLRPLTPFQQGIIDRILTGDMSQLGYAELHSLREDAHWHYPQYPNLLAIWRERGEPYFQAAQAERLAALY